LVNPARTRPQLLQGSVVQQGQHHLDSHKEAELVEVSVNRHLVRNHQEEEHLDHQGLDQHLPARKLLEHLQHLQHLKRSELHLADSALPRQTNHHQAVGLDNRLSVKIQRRQRVDSDHPLSELVPRQHQHLDHRDSELSQLMEVHSAHRQLLEHLDRNHLEMASRQLHPHRPLAVSTLSNRHHHLLELHSPLHHLSAVPMLPSLRLLHLAARTLRNPLHRLLSEVSTLRNQHPVLDNQLSDNRASLPHSDHHQHQEHSVPHHKLQDSGRQLQPSQHSDQRLHQPLEPGSVSQHSAKHRSQRRRPPLARQPHPPQTPSASRLQPPRPAGLAVSDNLLLHHPLDLRPLPLGRLHRQPPQDQRSVSPQLNQLHQVGHSDHH